MAQTALQRNDNTASSSSPSTSYAHYQVFINHRGPDVKNTFASHLYHRLQSIGLPVFLDKPELVEGCTFPSQIEAAIQRAAIHIAIFSPTYAESKWCLDELIHMIKTGATILPVFYKVKPCVLRWTGKDGHGEYAQALRKHEQDGRSDSQTIQNWREALCTAANISGFELHACEGDEGQLLEKVVGRVLNDVDRTPLKFVAEHPTGLKEKLQEFESRVLLQGPKKKVVAIVGPGGIGKTTLAKQYFSERRSHYRRSCILYNVREKAGKDCLPSLQRKLLKDLTGLDLQIDSIHEGIEQLMKHLSLSSSHFLLVLDDVDDVRQLEPFWPIKDIVSSNSLILITSRNKKILKTAKMGETAVYELKGLNMQQSKELFCHHAFQQPHPLREFADLVEVFSAACHGLPLSLKVFGALVCGEYDKSFWQEKLNALNSILPKEIQEQLKISYDSLGSKNQEVFLDISCFFLGKDIDTVIRTCGSIGDLENKCLLEVDSGKIKMHDQIRDMARSIADQKENPRRLWDQTTKGMDDLLELSSCRTIEVRGVTMKSVEDNSLPMSERPWYKRWSDELFENCLRCPFDNFRLCGILNLQFVAAEDGYLEQIVRRARAPHLQWIRWNNCTHSCLPSWIPTENLRVLEVCGRSKLRKLWERESQVPRQLRELFIDSPLSGFPKSMVQLKHLEKIDICSAQFKTLPKELCDVQSLKYLSLERCSKMISLPHSLPELTNLKKLCIKHCPELKCLPDCSGQLAQLTELYINNCPELKCLPDSFGQLAQLIGLRIYNCPELKCLPDSFGQLAQLTGLRIDNCPELKCLPDSFGQLAQLTWLDIYNCPELKCLPDSFGQLAQLTELTIYNCPELKCLPDSFGQLAQLTVLDIDNCPELKCLPDSFGQLAQLTRLYINNCPELKCLPDSFGQLAQLTRLRIYNCPELKCLPDSFGQLAQLTRLYIYNCPELKCLPDSFGQLAQLTELDIYNCPELKCLPESLGQLAQLTMPGIPLNS